MTDKTQLVNKIKNGTVIDHIPVNRGLKVLELLGSNISKIETAVIIINMVNMIHISIGLMHNYIEF